MARTLRTITVGKLRDLLEDEDQDALVIFAADYGDYHHTEQALPLRGDVEQVTISASAYSNSGWQVNTTDDEDEEAAEIEAPTYVVIR